MPELYLLLHQGYLRRQQIRLIGQMEVCMEVNMEIRVIIITAIIAGYCITVISKVRTSEVTPESMDRIGFRGAFYDLIAESVNS